MNEICGGLQYEAFKKDSFIIRYGEEGDKFYIILKGKVDVWLPMPVDSMKTPISRLLEKARNGNETAPWDFRFLKKVVDQKFGDNEDKISEKKVEFDDNNLQTDVELRSDGRVAGLPGMPGLPSAEHIKELDNEHSISVSQKEGNTLEEVSPSVS